ncbi:MAG TPA: Hsp20/alpha crystallin family protein [Methylomirabilota bacterium]|jgi:HSP20 family protein|nr:Hsp20/alpha crystallin family protein [Methylomirabilota bacterium]
MTNLMLRDPFFEDLFDFRRDFDKIFNRILTVRPWGKEEEVTPWTAFNFAPAVEAYVDKEAKKYVCKVSLPGIEPKEVQINVQGNMLTITGERKLTRTAKEPELHYQEFTYGKFERALELPEGLNLEKMNAEFVNGVLEITAPVAAAALPRKIEVKAVQVVAKAA